MGGGTEGFRRAYREGKIRSRRCLQIQRRRAAGPHLPYPSSPRGRGGIKKKHASSVAAFLPSLPRGERGRGSEGRRRDDAEFKAKAESEARLPRLARRRGLAGHLDEVDDLVDAVGVAGELLGFGPLIRGGHLAVQRDAAVQGIDVDLEAGHLGIGDQLGLDPRRHSGVVEDLLRHRTDLGFELLGTLLQRATHSLGAFLNAFANLAARGIEVLAGLLKVLVHLLPIHLDLGPALFILLGLDAADVAVTAGQRKYGDAQNGGHDGQCSRSHGVSPFERMSLRTVGLAILAPSDGSPKIRKKRGRRLILGIQVASPFREGPRKVCFAPVLLCLPVTYPACYRTPKCSICARGV